MTDPVVQMILSIGGYIISLLLGVVLFLMKRELARHDDVTKKLETKLDESKQAFEVRVVGVETMQREKWEKHAERHLEDAEKVEAKREHVLESVQSVRTDLMSHCAESNDRFLTKDEFVSSSNYLTKKTDEVSRLLQSIENILARR